MKRALIVLLFAIGSWPMVCQAQEVGFCFPNNRCWNGIRWVNRGDLSLPAQLLSVIKNAPVVAEEEPLPRGLEQLKIFVAQDFPWQAAERIDKDVNHWLRQARNIEIISRGELQTAFPAEQVLARDMHPHPALNTGKITIMIVYHYRVK